MTEYLDLDKVYKKRENKIKREIVKRRYKSNDYIESKFRNTRFSKQNQSSPLDQKDLIKLKSKLKR
jgi:hypothetical protein